MLASMGFRKWRFAAIVSLVLLHGIQAWTTKTAYRDVGTRIETVSLPWQKKCSVLSSSVGESHEALVEDSSADFESAPPPTMNGEEPALKDIPDNEEDSFVWTRQWYPVLPLEFLDGLDLEKKPFPIEILNQKLVIWKTSGDQYSILQDTCIHRRAPLSTGKVIPGEPNCKSATLACRYHGWEFDGQGRCTKIPMMLENQTTRISNLRVPSYPVKTAGGFLWVFMDPSFVLPGDESQQDDERRSPLVPELDERVFLSDQEMESSTILWGHQVSPVSYKSMLENLFDPSHALFVHEGYTTPGGFGKYGPHNAHPMERYERGPLSKSGFQVFHSPYLQQNYNVSTLTTREFIAPCTTLVSSPGFDSRIYFIPNSLDRTTTVGVFKVRGTSKGRFHKFTNFLPKSWKQTWMNWRHLVATDRRFQRQDTWIMQGQDRRKWEGGDKWEDMVVTPSDVGVATLQRWMRKYGQGGPFAGWQQDLVLLASSSSSSSQKKDDVAVHPELLSPWDSHARYCSKCQAALKQLSRWQKRLAQVSTLFWIPTAAAAAVAALLVPSSSSSRLWNFSCMIGVVLSVVAQFASSRLERLQRNFFTSLGSSNIQSHSMESTYQYD